ncbi:MAG: hypothetical protein ACKV2U_05190 [Bryobacteraceae bacterium]
MIRLIMFVMAAGAAFASWEDVRSLAENHKIEIVVRKGEPARGSFVSASETAVTVREKTGERSIARADIRRVRVADPSRRARNGLIAAAIGAGIGFAIGFAVCPQCESEGAGAKYTGPLTAAGAGLGAAAGLLPAPRRTIYKAK